MNPHYSYYDEHNHVHQVWMLDGVTAYNELRAAERAGVRGTALWRLGRGPSHLVHLGHRRSPTTPPRETR